MIAANCPACRWPHFFEPADLGEPAECKSCRTPFIPAEHAVSSAPAQRRPPVRQPRHLGLLVLCVLALLVAVFCFLEAALGVVLGQWLSPFFRVLVGIGFLIVAAVLGCTRMLLRHRQVRRD